MSSNVLAIEIHDGTNRKASCEIERFNDAPTDSQFAEMLGCGSDYFPIGLLRLWPFAFSRFHQPEEQ